MSELLVTRAVSRYFGGLAAVSNLNLTVRSGELVGLIGPNGAGKTTVFNLLTGVYTPTSGDVMFEGKRVNGLRPYKMARIGIARTFQNIRLFRALTVLQNVQVAAALRARQGFWSAVLRTPRQVHDDAAIRAQCMELLDRLDLAPYADTRADALAYGVQRRLEIARALATHPSLLLLDEPAAGLNPNEKSELMSLVERLRDEFSLTVLLIEHDMRVVMGICERIYVLDYGEIIAEGAPDAIAEDPKVIAAYLGTEEA
ncbi:MAG: ABC transporter ATP-binding protein [Chthonomonadales bacterium]|nr:ABC transporter ATP-binding protein [Chthonomonadales bacterium]